MRYRIIRKDNRIGMSNATASSIKNAKELKEKYEKATGIEHIIYDTKKNREV